MWGAQEKSEGAHQKNFGRRFAPALCPPHLQIASDATGARYGKAKLKGAQLTSDDRAVWTKLIDACCVLGAVHRALQMRECSR